MEKYRPEYAVKNENGSYIGKVLEITGLMSIYPTIRNICCLYLPRKQKNNKYSHPSRRVPITQSFNNKRRKQLRRIACIASPSKNQLEISRFHFRPPRSLLDL